MIKKKKKLLWQIYHPYLLTIIIALVLISWYASSALYGFFINNTQADLEARAHILQTNVSQLLSPLNPSAIERLCKDAGFLSSTRITIILPDGKVIGDSGKKPSEMASHEDRPEIVNALKGKTGSAIRFSETLAQNMMYVAIPIDKDNGTLAVIRTSMPLTSIESEIKRIQMRIALAGLLIAILAAVTSLLVSRRISRPIEEMKNSAQQFARGNFELKLAIPDSEELASLAGAMNQMAGQLDERMAMVINQRNELKAILSSMHEGVIAIDTLESIISINKAATHIFDCGATQMQGGHIQETVRDLGLNRFISHATVSEQPEEKDIELLRQKKQILNIRSRSLMDSTGRRMGTLLIVSDVTKLRKLENMRQDFAANVSHEIKTPLTAIKGFVETLNHGAIDDPEESRRFLTIIENNVNRLNMIIEDLLTLSRIEQEGEQKNIIFINDAICPTVRSAINVCQNHIEDRKITIELDCPENIMTKFDSQLLEQAIVNLLTNAVKYSPTDNTVTVTAKETENSILIDVQDYGAGIAAKHIPRLFERFYRVDKSRSREMGGTGLGLAITKHIVQVHGGIISVNSTVGKGSTFTIELPRS